MSDATRRTLRTIVQSLLGLAAATPLIINSAGIPRTAAGVGTALAIAAGLTSIMSLDAVQKLLPSWLRVKPPAVNVSPIPLSPPQRRAQKPSTGGAV